MWGTYDVAKPRVRMLLAGARAVGMDVVECHADVWSGIEDKSQVRGRGRLTSLVRWLRAYPGLARRYLALPPHDAILVPYLGQADVLILWLFARSRGVPVCWDAFISLYDTTVRDRRLVGSRSPAAWLLFCCEWLTSRAATAIFLDTDAHAEYFESLLRLKRGSVGTVLVGTDFRAPPRRARPEGSGRFTVLFYGQFSPLHGLETIVRAASLLEREGETIRWLLVGHGQDTARIDELINTLQVKSIERISWLPSEQIPLLAEEADVCLGVFGTSQKARRVIPNKVFQVLAMQRPLVTADNPAVRALVGDHPAVRLVPPGDPVALAAAIRELKATRPDTARLPPLPIVDERVVGEQLLSIVTGSGDWAAS